MPTTITEHKKCICVEFGDTNNNKVWQYTLYGDGSALTEWGRVGNSLQSKITTEAKALKKWGEKTNPNNKPDKRYTEVKAVDTGGSVSVSASSVKNAELQDVAKKQIKSKNPVVNKLVAFLVKVNAHQIMKQSGGKIIYDAESAQFKTPLGVIAPDQVAEARDLLVEISDFVSNRDFDDRGFAQTLNSYLRLIPHDVGMTKITPELVFPDTQTVIAENDLLDGLESSFIDVTTAKPKKKTTKKKKVTPAIFNVEIEIVTDNKVIDRIKSYYLKTKRSMHTSCRYKLKTIYKTDIETVVKAFENKGKKVGNIRELFHGSRCSNVLSILRQGLIIPSASASHCTGRLGGNGCYGSDISSKALNYSTNFWGGSGGTDRIFMFLCSFAMGKMYRSRGYGDYRTPKDGYDSNTIQELLGH